ncbi:hypothetical protein BH20VER2_BH20VER2_00180 [soil metagenome]
MNSQTDLTAARFRGTLLAVALVVCPFFAFETGHAQMSVVTATLTNNGSSTVNITSNQSFSLTLTINTNFSSLGISYFLQSNFAGSGLFRIISRDTTGSPYPIPSPMPVNCFNDNACLLDPVNGFDLGATVHGLADVVPPGMYPIATITFNTMNAPLGQYTISTDLRSIVTDRNGFADVPFTALATINVVPEPTSVGLVLLGGAMLSGMVWRRQRRRAQVGASPTIAEA